MGAVLIFVAAWSSDGHAQDSADLAAVLAETRAQLEALQAKVAELEAQIQDAPDIHVAALEERVEELEVVAVEVDESIGSRAVTNAFDAVSLDIGGFFDSSVTVAIGEENTDASFNRQVFELLAKAKLGPNWELFVAQAFVRNAPLTYSDTQRRTTPSFGNNNSPVVTDTVIAWGQYHHSDMLNIRFGRFITPLGIVNVEHFPASLLDTEQPLFLRPFPGQSLFANFTNGINIHGSTFLGDDNLTYSAYAGVWAGNSTSAAFGGRLAYSIGTSGLTFGVNGLSGDRSSTVLGDRFNGGGIDLLYDKGRLLWKSELFATSEDGGDDRLAFYTQPAFRISNRLTAFYRYDQFDNGSTGGERVEHTGGIVFDPIDNVRLRALYRNQLNKADTGFDAASTNIIQFATTFNF